MGTRVEAGWALYGKTAGSADDYRVLRASDAYFSRSDYDAILRRFVPGTPPAPSRAAEPGALPWATISYAPLRPGSAPTAGSATVQGLAVCDWTRLRDAAGRPVSVTAYLCAPFASLAAVPMSYQSLYRTLRTDPAVSAVLGGQAAVSGAGGPLPLDLFPGFDPTMIAAPLDADDETFRLAAGIAALLLRQPVALVGAPVSDPATRITERLRFLDAVAALLPYGQRARLVASTWADAGSTHRIRLAYTDRARPGDAEIMLPGPRRAGRLPPLPRGAAEYYALLLDLHGRHGLSAARIVGHLAAAPYRPGHPVDDPDHALLTLADLPGPGFFATCLPTAAPIASSPLVEPPTSAGTVDLGGPPAADMPALTIAPVARPGAARELVSATTAMVRLQRVRRRLLAGTSTVEVDQMVLGQVAAHPVGPAIALELVRRAIEDDLRDEAAGRAPQAAGVPAAAAHTAGWLGWLAEAPRLVEAVRPFADMVAGPRRPVKVDFPALTRVGRALWGDSRYPLAAVRLARLTGHGQQVRQPLREWLTRVAVLGTLSPVERAAWAEEIGRATAGTGDEEAHLDFACLLLGARPLHPLATRMTSRYRFTYRAALFEDFDLMVEHHESRPEAIEAAGRVMDGLAASLDDTGWPTMPGVQDEILDLLEMMVVRVHRLPNGLRDTMGRYLSPRTGQSRHPRGVHQTWSDLIRSYVSGPNTRSAS